MPEGDTIWRTARTLTRAIGSRVVTRFETVLPKLARIDDDTPVAGRTVESIEAEGKWLVTRFSGGLILLTHMLMSGTWHIYRPGERWQRARSGMRIVIETAEWLAVAFNVPVAEFHSEESLARRKGLRSLGPKVRDDEFDVEQAIANLRSRPESEIGVALVTQSLVAGLGNIFKSEVCFAGGVHPFRKVASLSDEELHRLMRVSVKLMHANITDRKREFKVYRRTGEPCPNCGTAIESRRHSIDARSSFWCPRCQP